MKRRDVLRAIGVAGTGGLTTVACGVPPAIDGVTDADISRMAQFLTGESVPAGQAAAIRELLQLQRGSGMIANDVQPSLLFDPEVE